MSRVKFEDYQFHYSLTGDRQKPLILFLHGFMGSSNDFDDAIALLTHQFSCLAVDLPGHGKTKVHGAEECYAMTETAQALIHLLKYLNIEKCFLFGYSMGGRLALYLALHFPERFHKVVLESASPGLKTKEERLSRIQQDTQLAQKLQNSDFKSFLLDWYEQQIWKSLKEHPNFNSLLKRRFQNNPKELSKSLIKMGTSCQPSLWELLKQNKVPILLLVGQKDNKFIKINAEMAKHCQVTTLKIISGCGHNIHFENLEKWVRYVPTFFLM